jgi:NTP pyrophosphatase (non-canonical NTP hydrolase)
MKNLDKLLVLQEQYTQYNPWFHSCDPDFYLKSMVSEISEAMQELENKDNNALEDELGDVLWLMINTLKKAESLNQISIEMLIDRSIEKFHERMPYIRE